MKRVSFEPATAEPGAERPRVAVLVEMAGGRAAVAFDGKQVGAPVKRSELLRGFECNLPDGSSLRVQAFVIESTLAGGGEESPTEKSLASDGAFEPYRVRAWMGGDELREVVGQASREDARIALLLLLLVGVSESVIGARLYSFGGPTRFLFTGPVFLLGAASVWRKWAWGVTAALAVATADTFILAARAAQDGQLGSVALTIVARVVLISFLMRLRKGSW